MRYKEFLKKAKRFLAFALALTLFLGGWSNYDFSVRATETENAGDGPEDTEPVEDVEATKNAERSEGDTMGDDPAADENENNPGNSGEDDTPTDDSMPDTDSLDNVMPGTPSEDVTSGTNPPQEENDDGISTDEGIPGGNPSSVTSSPDAAPTGGTSSEDNPEAGGTEDDGSIKAPSTGIQPTEVPLTNVQSTGVQAGVNSVPGGIMPLADDNTFTVELEYESAVYTGGEIEFPDVTVKATVDGEERTLTGEDYEVSWNDEAGNEVYNARKIGTYKCSVKGISTYVSYTGEAEFTVKYDESITKDNLNIENAYEGTDVYYFRDTATIKAISEYSLVEITDDGSAEEVESKEISSTTDNVVIYLKSQSGSIGQIELGKFEKDETEPTVSIQIEYDGNYLSSDSAKWAKSIKSSSFTATDELSGVKAIYYTTDETLTKDDLESMTVCSSGEEVFLESGTTYYYFAVDNVGNISEKETYDVYNLDDNGPVITVKDGEKEIGNGETVYLNKEALNSGAKVYEVTADDKDGVGYDEQNWTPETTFTPTNLEASINGEVIENKLKDYLGNEGTHSFTIVYDAVAPKISTALAFDGDASQGISDSILTKNDVTIKARVTDDIMLDKVVLVDSDNNEINMNLLSEDAEGYTHSYTISEESYLKNTYQVVAYDKAGNRTEGSTKFVIEIDKEAPVSWNVESSSTGGWTKEDITFTVTITYERGADPVAKYKKGDEGNWSEITPASVNGSTWTFTVTEEDDIYQGNYFFMASDKLGNDADLDKEIYIQKDKIPPSKDGIMVEYVSDPSLDSSESIQKEDFVKQLIQGVTDRFFAKTEIIATLYIKDQISGVDSITCTYADQDIGEFKVQDGATAEIDGESFCIIPVKVTLKGNYAGILKITEITDKAGNIVLGSTTPSIVAEGTRILVVDNVSPELTVSYPEAQGEDGERLFYSPQENEDAEIITLNVKEAFYDQNVDNDGDPIKPVVKILKKGDGETVFGEFDSADRINYKVSENNDGFTITVKLPYEKEKEVEYKIVATYQDGSDNYLKGNNVFGSVTDENGYESNIFVLDSRNPQLLSYEITTTPAQDASGNAYEFDGANVYKNDLQKEDVTLTFSIDDNAEYWNKEELTFEIYDTSDLQNPVISIDGNNQDLSWNEPLEGRIHKATYSFDGQANVEANYQVQITYSDRAGNKMVDGRTDSTGEELPGEINTTTGTYTSPEFILDHKAPEINVTYNNAYRVIDGTGANEDMGIHPVTDQTAYYGSKDSNGNPEGKIVVTVQITDKYLKTKKAEEQSEDIILEDINVIAEKNGNNVDVTDDLEWTKEGTTYLSSFTINSNTSEWGDGDYKVKVLFQESAYTDAAGNEMSATDTIQGGKVDGGKYTSTTLILDTTVPVLKKSYTATPVNTYGGRDYFDTQTNLVITVEDQNIRYGELKNVLAKMTATDINGKPVEGTDAKTFIDKIEAIKRDRGSWTATIPLTTEANYRIPISYVDLAGNAAVLNTVDQVTVDTTTPADLEFDYSINDPVNYGLFGWLFAQTKMTVRATAKDGTAGLQYIRFTIVDENKKETVRTGEFAPSADGSYSVEIPLESADFKGTVKAEVYDYSNNQIEQTRNHVVESGGKHSSTGSAVITTRTSPSRTVDGEDFYNTDVTFNLTLKDDYSGLRSYTYTGGSTLSGSRNYAEEAGTVLGEGGPEVTYEFSQDMTLAAAQNNENEVKVSAEFVDNAGHTGQVEQLYNIDVTDPEITVEWDLNDPANELYYNQTRTATVTIRERNFDADDVEFTVTNTDGAMPTFGGWSSSGSGDNTEHVCQVTFDQDGDYTFTLSFQDKAGNEASYDRVDEFTIDKTFPELTVTWNNNNSQNEFYYAESRTATIDILEHNFDPNLIDVVTTADGASAPNVSGWSRNGDHNVATVTFSADADYTFDIEGMDLAENALDEYEQEQFTVDQTAPELEIFDIENMSANNGIVMPGVRYSDTNYDPDATVIAMTGYHNGPVEMNGTRTAAANGMEIKLNDFEHVPEMDDMYTMEATVYDLAGNSSEASVIFSVNRFGSVYTFSDATDALVGDNGKYYTNEEQEIVVTETNVDTLEFREITKNLNGSLNTMAEGEEYTVSESGTDVSWKQYTYTIPKENFEEEGTYILTIYSEDRAANTSDNNTKGKQIEFVVDKTSPSILVSGVENDGQYRENSRPVTLDVQDNIRLAEVQVQIDGEETVYTAEEIVEADGKLTLTAGSANHWQEMSVTARDAAGNEETAETIRFLITSNIFVQFFMNKPLFYGTLIALAAAAAGGWRLWIVLKKRKDKEEQQ